MSFSDKQQSIARVELLLAEGKRQAALDLCQKLCASPGAVAQDWQLYGKLAAESGDLARARHALEHAVMLAPDLVEARIVLGRVLAAIGDTQAALLSLHETAGLQPDNPEVWLALGITSGLAQRIDDAETYCRRSLQLRPESAEARFNLANALQAQGRFGEAEPEYAAALAISPGLTAGWSMLAQARVGLRKLAEAEDAARQALRLNPANGQAHLLLGNILNHRGERQQALEHLLQAATLHPEIPDAHMNLGQVLYALDDFEEAAESFQRVINLRPGYDEAHFMLGQCFQERKMRGRAENCYRKAIAINNDHLQSHYCLAFICAQMDRHEEAARQYREVLRLNPNDDQARHLLAAQLGETTTTAPAAYVATLFDGFADHFDEKLVDELGYRTPGLLHEMVETHIPAEPVSLDIIDLGCGTGLCAPLLRKVARTLHGVDLSSGMIEKARERGLYDALEVNDIVASLSGNDATWDLAVSADVFVYVGDLEETFAACARALRPGGWFAFSVESGDDADTYILRNTGRYAHASSYITKLAMQTGFVELDRRAVILRKDKGLVDIHGYIYLLRRTDEDK